MNNKSFGPQTVERLTVSSLATIYGCCGLFDLCGDEDLISLTMQGSSPFFDWLQWLGTDECIIENNFITWNKPTEGSRQGWLSDPCADPNSTEWGTCAFRYNDFARMRRAAPTQDATKNHLRLCERQPRYRLDGTLITDDKEYNAVITMDQILQDVSSLAIIGNQATAGQFDGLQTLVATGYTDYNGRRCRTMDSIIINWNNNQMSGGAGITWTDGRGARNVSANANFVDVLHSAYRHVRQRIKWSPTLSAQRLQVGDMILMGTTEATQELLDFYVDWKVRPGVAFAENNSNSLEARELRDRMLGGLFGDGRIFLDGFEIPLLAYDWELQKGPTTSDLYLLIGSVGNVKTMLGQHNNMNAVPASFTELNFFVSDGGRFLHWWEHDHTCIQQVLEFQPRIISWAPFLNIRFQNVVVRPIGGHLGPDPMDTSYFPESSFSVATC